ncbi:MAG: RNA methyltransferase [Acidobacteria bacterium]|nr:RNA methyltransferase [Acidobacteriota bacterium]
MFAHTGDPDWLRANGLFVGEGRQVARRLLASAYHTVAMLLTPSAEAVMREAVDALPADRQPVVDVCSQAEMTALTGYRLHQGCVAIAERAPLPAWTSLAGASGLVVALERVRDPDNVGSIARSASALGAAGVIIGPECADPLYRKAVRTSMGALVTMPVVSGEPWPETLAGLAAAGYTLVATTPDEAAPTIQTVSADLAHAGRDRRVVLLVGSEGEGLTEEARRAAHVEARIPMAPGVMDSLNVAVATAVAIYALRERQP